MASCSEQVFPRRPYCYGDAMRWDCGFLNDAFVHILIYLTEFIKACHERLLPSDLHTILWHLFPPSFYRLAFVVFSPPTQHFYTLRSESRKPTNKNIVVASFFCRSDPFKYFPSCIIKAYHQRSTPRLRRRGRRGVAHQVHPRPPPLPTGQLPNVCENPVILNSCDGNQSATGLLEVFPRSGHCDCLP